MITRYEITARHPDGREYLIGYTPRLSRPGLLSAMQKNGSALISRLAIGENDEITFGTKPRIHCMTSGWTIGFTGRTQLDAKAGGVREFIVA